VLFAFRARSGFGLTTETVTLQAQERGGKEIRLSKVLGVAFDSADRLYVLETSNSDAAGGFPVPGTGDVVRINFDGTVETIDSGLTFPTAMTFGPDGKLYVSNFGFGFPPGQGQVVRITVP